MRKANSIIVNNDLMQKLIDLMNKANKAIMDVYKDSDKEVVLKANNSPVTKADLAADNILKKGLKKLFPEIPVVSEEDASSLDIPKTNKVFWLIDPLDGTKEFINKSDEFTCNLALIENHFPSLGFVSVPVKEQIYYGGRNLGSFKINNAEGCKSIKCSSINGLTRIVASKSHLNDKTKEFINSIKTKVDLVQAGSSLKFLKIAEGKADIYPRLGPTSEWDTAAAHAILEGAGGRVQQINGEELSYGKEDILNPNFIAHGEKLE